MHFHIPRYRRQQIKEASLTLGKFALTVICAALLSCWIQNHSGWRLRRMLVSLSPSASSRAAATTRANQRAVSEGTKENLSELYSKYLGDVFHTLRADRRVRMVSLLLPNAILNYQRFLASDENGATASLRLEGRAASIPVIAVSRGIKAYLEQMRVTYIDPKGLPARLLDPNGASLSGAALQQYLLVPDLSGPNAHKFYFARR